MKYTAFIILFLLVYLVLFRPIRKRVLQTMPTAALAPAQGHLLKAPAELPPVAAPKALAGATRPEEVAAPAAAEPSPLLPQAEEAAAREGMFDLDAIDDKIERDFMKEATMVDLGSRKYAILKKKLMDRAKKEPEMVSQLIRTWIQEKG